MPQINFRGVSREDVRKASKDLPLKLSEICSTTEDNFIFECPAVEHFACGRETKSYPLVEVKLFDRGGEVEKNFYTAIKVFLENLGYSDIEVYFIHLDEAAYFY